MERNPAKFDRYAMVSATRSARCRVQSAVDYAAKLQQDPERERRLEAGRCVACYYSTGLAGAAFTSQPCACCLTPQRYPSTKTDALCLACAQQHSLCKHCGGDLEMHEGRREWPQAREGADTAKWPSQT